MVEAMLKILQKGHMQSRHRNTAVVRGLIPIVFSVACLSAFSGSAWAQLPPAAKPLPILTHADQIRRLSPQDASLRYPVLIRGVITMDAPAPDFFVQDATAGIYVEGSPSPKYSHLLGQIVEIEGVTGPGKFAPVIRETKLRMLGKGELPQCKAFFFLRTGEWARRQSVGASARHCAFRRARPRVVA